MGAAAAPLRTSFVAFTMAKAAAPAARLSVCQLLTPPPLSGGGGGPVAIPRIRTASGCISVQGSASSIHTPLHVRSLAAAATRCHERPLGTPHAAPASRRAARGVPHRLHHRGALRRTASAFLPSAPRAAGARGSAALGAPRRCPRAADFVFDAAGAPPRAGQTTPALRASCSRPPAPVPGEAGRYPPAAALLVRRLVVPVLNKLLQLPLLCYVYIR